MKKCFLAVVVLGFVFGMMGVANAAPSANVTVKFTVQNLSVLISTDQVVFGVVSPGAFLVTNTTIVVTNDGNATETFQLQTSTFTAPSNFQLSTSSPSTNAQFRALAVFNTFQPGINAYDGATGSPDVLTGTSTSASATNFAGDQTGSGVPPSNNRNLFLRIDAPTGNPAGGEQSFTVTITAIP